MPLIEHGSFNRPPVSTRLWRYMDFPKFVDLLTSQRLWLTNAEILAREDPYEGAQGAIGFPHRMWRNLNEVPEKLRAQILRKRRGDGSLEAIFRDWFMMEEQRCILAQFGRRQYYVNCWHAAQYESVAMWRIYGGTNSGIAIVANGARIVEALAGNSETLHLGAVSYSEPGIFEIGTSNAFDPFMVKRVSYSYESEVHLVHWDISDQHDPLEKFSWNEETMRFVDIVEDLRPITPGRAFHCDVDVLIERVLLSPFAPGWYLPMINRLREKLNFNFPISASQLLTSPSIIP